MNVLGELLSLVCPPDVNVRGTSSAFKDAWDSNVTGMVFMKRGDLDKPRFENLAKRFPKLVNVDIYLDDESHGAHLLLDHPDFAARLQRLCLTARAHSEEGLALMELALALCVRLTEVRLACQQNTVVGRLLAALGGGRELRYLTALVLDGAASLKDLGPTLFKVLPRMTVLRRLDMKSAIFVEDVAQAIIEHAPPSLCCLRITIPNDSSRQLLRMIDGLALRLTDLCIDYGYTLWSSNTVSPSFHLLSALTRFDLSTTSVSPLAIHLPVGIALLTGLTYLRLEILAEHVEAAVQSIRALPCLKELVLERIHLSICRGALAPALDGLASVLRTLRILNCDLTPSCVEALGPALKRLAGLTHLDLSRNTRLGPDGAFVLEQWLPPALTCLGLRNIGLGPTGLLALAPRLAMLRGLRRLDLSRNGLGRYKGVDAVLNTISRLRALKELDVLDAENCFGDAKEHLRIREVLGGTNSLMSVS